MPTAPRRICPRCRQPTRGRCTTCTTTQQQQRDSPTARGYDTNWRRTIRPDYLANHPDCALCGQPATVPDHWPTTRRALIQAHVPDPDAWHRLRPLCTSCHAQHGQRTHHTQ